MSETEKTNKEIKRFRTKKNDSVNYKKYYCSECGREYLSQTALYIHKRHKHAYLIKKRKCCRKNSSIEEENKNTEIQPTLNGNHNLINVENENTCTSNSFKNVISNQIKEVYFSNNRKFYEPIIKNKLKLLQYHALYKEYEIFANNEEEYKKDDPLTFVIDKVLFLYLMECYRMNYSFQNISKTVFYTILLREFINSEKQKDLSLHFLIDFTSFKYADEIILISNDFLTYIEEIEKESEISSKIKLEEVISYFKELAEWLYENDFTQLKLT